MDIMSIVSYSCLAFLLVGFFIGFFRSFKKSMTRCILILISLIAAIFLTPVLSKLLINTFVDGYVFEGFGFTFDFEETIAGMLPADAVSDILNSAATQNLILSIMNILINIVMFIVLFVALLILTLIFFWIGSFIVFLTNRKKEDYQIKKMNRKKISNRLLGGLFGFIASLSFCFMIAIPVYGIMNICDKFLEEAQTQTETAVAANFNNMIAGKMFYTENEQIGEIEGIVEQYSQIKNTIDGSAIGKVSKALGIASLGAGTFDYLTTVEHGGLNVSLTNEVVTVIKAYNIYKEGFVVNEFDKNDKESLGKALDAVELIYKEAENSSILKSYLVELVPKMREKWIAGETFMGMEFPIEGEYRELALIIIDKGFNTYNIAEINNNVYAIINVAKIANESGLLEAMEEDKNFIEVIEDDDTNLIKNIIITLSNSKFGEALPNLLEDLVKMAYDLVINTDGVLSEEGIDSRFESAGATVLPDNINWEVEAENLQTLIKDSLAVADVFYSSESESTIIVDNLDSIGRLIDTARKSTFSLHFKVLVEDMINIKLNSEILGTDATSILKATLIENWTNADYSFESMFNVLKQSAQIAQKLTTTFGDINSGSLEDVLTNLESVVSEIISGDAAATFETMLSKDVIEKFIPEEYQDTVDVVKEVFISFIDNTTEETLKADVVAGKEIINIVNIAQNSEEVITQEKATEMVENIANSETIMNIVTSAVSDESASAALKDITAEMSSENNQVLVDAINDIKAEIENDETQTNKVEHLNALLKLFE